MELLQVKIDKSQWMYFWLKTIRNIDLTKHCAKSFIGEYLQYSDVKNLDKNLIHYMCGVYKGFNYAKNFHLAFEYCEGETLIVNEKDVFVEIKNAKRIPIVGLNKGEGLAPYCNNKSYYTCRNWQFANQIKHLF